MARKVVVALDIYGTILTMETIAQEIEKQFPQANAEAILKTWRQHQLAYTWRLNCLGASVYGCSTERSLLEPLCSSTCEQDAFYLSRRSPGTL